MQQRPIFALALRLAGALSFATMALLIKLAGERGATLPQIMFWRQAVPVPALLGYLWLTGGLGLLKTRRLGSHGRRSLIGMLGMVCNFGAVLLLPLAEATVLGFTAPLFAVAIGSLVLREHVGPWRWTAVALGFAGVLIIAQPGDQPISLIGTLAGLGAGLCVGIVSYQIRDLARSEQSISIVFYFSAFGMAIAAAMLPFAPAPRPDPEQLALLVSLGLAGTLGQLLMTASLRHGAIASVIVMDYSSLLWAALFGWAAFGSLPALATWFGAPSIVAAGIVIAWREHRLSRESAPFTA